MILSSAMQLKAQDRLGFTFEGYFRGKVLLDVLTVKLVTFHAKPIKTDDLTRVKLYTIVAFSSMLLEVKRSVSSLWNYGFHYALLSETGFKGYANGVV